MMCNKKHYSLQPKNKCYHFFYKSHMQSQKHMHSVQRQTPQQTSDDEKFGLS